MSRHLIAIAVGPVQEFIASARKLKDLWYGSHLLSSLAGAVARSLVGQNCELIFPALSGQDLREDRLQGLSNKLLALGPEDSDPAEIAAAAREDFYAAWRRICEEAQDRAGKIIPSLVDNRLFAAQIDDFGEFFAAWTSFDGKEYQAARDECENLLTGRKCLRDFSVPAWDGKGLPKSSLDGVRESVLGAIPERAWMVKKGEHLDALGVVKRFGPMTGKGSSPHFESLSEVAVLPYLAGLRAAAVEQVGLAELLAEFPAIADLYPDKGQRPPAPVTVDGSPDGFPADLLIPALFEAAFAEHGSGPAKDVWKKARKVLRSLWKKAGEPDPYACLLVGDGDRIGQALDSLHSIEEHRRFSTALDDFAASVPELVAKHNGRVIYSGGDDVMAYLPLDSALACAIEINELFGGKMAGAVPGNPPTFSAGLAIVHHRLPLHRGLEAARKAEQFAKNEGGRDSLAVIQAKRSGSDIITCGKWRNPGAVSFPDRLDAFAELYEKNALSSRLGYQLRTVAAECGTTLAWNAPGEPGNSAAAETLRFIGRKKPQGAKSVDPEVILAGVENLRALSDELVVARHLSLARKLAAGPGNNGRKG